METDVRILEIQPFFTREQSRTPLKFGGVVMDSAWLCHVRVVVENRRGQEGEGWGAIFLSDVWGWPSSRVGHAEREDLMVQLVTAWCRRLGEVRDFAHPIDLFWELEPELETLTHGLCRDAGAAEEMPRLNALICASAADAAVHDAFGNAAGIDTYLGYGPGHMDHDLSRWLGPSYAGRYVEEFLHPLPEQVDAFHLVGGMDKLSENEITADDPDDGLPVSLDQWIRYEALRCLKVKLVGTDLEWDLNRLLEVHRLARTEQSRLGVDELWLTADTNEMCDTPQYMVELLVRLKEQNRAAFDSLLYVEQPCERDLRRRMLDMTELRQIKPVIVDEALSSLEDLELALELGYSGLALKTCKCQSAELVLASRAAAAGVPFAVQDLTNPGIALLQSAGLAGRLQTIRGVESNSRQFFPASSEPERAIHPGFFKLEQGRIRTSTLRGTGLGYQWDRIDRPFEST